MIDEATAAAWNVRGVTACRQCLNPFKARAAYEAMLNCYFHAAVPLHDTFYAIECAMEFAWGWEQALQGFKDEWIGVPPEQRKP